VIEAPFDVRAKRLEMTVAEIERDEFYDAADAERAKQTEEALADLDRPASAYLRWPWESLNALYGGMAPGQVHYVVGFSGMGKTTFIASALDRWAKAGVAIDVLPLEVKANTFRTYMACQSLGIDPGYMLSGDFWEKAENPERIRDLVKARIDKQETEHAIRVRSTPSVTVAALRDAVEQAWTRGAQALIVDHIDHIQGSGGAGGGAEDSRAVNQAALDLAQEYDMLVIAMSQANQEALKGSRDKLAKYNVLSDNHVWMGAKKRQISSGQLSLFRPFKPFLPGDDPDEYKALMHRCRAGDEPPRHALWEGRAGIALMKSRSYGGREGDQVHLRVENGYYTDLNAEDLRIDEQKKHGIATTSRGNV
jgi:KaiC/GvpD/RAD55 family RecA-like ATPase